MTELINDLNICKKRLVLLIGLFMFIIISLFAVEQVSIYDIQFSVNPGFDGTYPSPFVNQTVLVEGIVTAIRFENNRIFISEPNGGAWSAIAIDHLRDRVSLGDNIQVQGRVSEIMGMTVITQPQNLIILSRNNSVPSPVTISINDALTMEAYESVLVRISNLTCKRLLNGSFLALVEDETASINIGNGFSTSLNNDFFSVGTTYQSIIGIVNFSHNRFSIHPRYIDDVGDVQTGIRSSSWGQIKSMYR